MKKSIYTNEGIYEMNLHEMKLIDDGDFMFSVHILRVSGGYIYTIFDKSHAMSSSSFVPFDNEFMNKQGE